MSSAAWELQKAIHQKLVTSPEIVSVLGGPHVWDHVPRGAAFPYMTFGVTSQSDWSTGTEDGGEHIVTLHIWSRAAGRHEVDDAVRGIREALHDMALTLAGHVLVNLRVEFSDARRDVERELFHGVVRLRAVTEASD